MFAVVWRRISRHEQPGPHREPPDQHVGHDGAGAAGPRHREQRRRWSNPDIGGSISTVDTKFLVAYGVHGDGIFPTNSGVLLVNLTANGIFSTPGILDGDTGCNSQPQVAVSRHGGWFGQFGVVYSHKRRCLSNAFDIAFAVVN